MTMKIKLIIFDLDGTLVDSGVDITNALNYAIAPYGLEKLTVETTIRTSIRRTMPIGAPM